MENPKNLLNHFQQYSSIQLSTNTKFLKTITNANFTQNDILWVATQKIHGANFSIVYDLQTDQVKYARRTDFITNPIPIPVKDVTPYFLQNFFDSSVLVNTFHNKLTKVKLNVQKKYQNILKIQIYGQYFGGFWPNNPNCKRRVQPGVYYTANHQFMVFDIKLQGQKFSTWVEVTEIPQILQDALKFVPIYGKGTYQQVQKINSQFDSTISQLLGLQRLKNNICEGLVLRPNKNLFAKNRIILKKKNKQFLEKAGFAKKDPQAKKAQHDEVTHEVQYLRTFLNPNRIESAISKYPDFEDQFHLKGRVAEDIIADATKQGWKLSENGKVAKEVNKKMDKIVLQQVVQYLQNQRKQFVDRIKKLNHSA